MDHCYSVSEENLRMLRDFSDLPASILPIVREYGSRNTERNESQISFRKRISSGYIDPVYVGRIVPNKKIEDLVRFFYFWKQIYPDAILRIIGSEITGFLDYSRFIKTTIQDLGLKDSIQFISGVSESEKRKILSDSGFFLSMSEHEGFCIPLIEAMEAKIPVFAFGSSAVPETLRKGGILFFNKDFLFLRELVAHFLEDDLLHEKILHSQKRALHFYESYPFQEKIQEILESGREIKSFVFDSKNPLLRKSI
jgi:glycosyltransferase involved in cell wall biosynthesis